MYFIPKQNACRGHLIDVPAETKVLVFVQASKAVAAILFGPSDDFFPESGGNKIPSISVQRCEGLKLRAMIRKAPIQATLTLTKAPAQYSGYGIASGVMPTSSSASFFKRGNYKVLDA